MLSGELLYTKILEVNLFAFAYRLCHEDFSSMYGVNMKVSVFEKSKVNKFILILYLYHLF